jgi:branched-subunit amino acid aminotransferase/4-amino-4-deoxychorismate lyase
MANPTNDTSTLADTSVPAHIDPSQGIFETILVVDDRPVELDLHLRRLHESAADLYGFDYGDRRLDIVSGARLERLRIDLIPADGSVGVELVRSPLEEAMLFPEKAVSLRSAVVEGGSLGCHKWVDRELISEHERLCAPSLPLFITSEETVLEVSRGNLFLIEDGRVVTPRADGRILPGVTRRCVTELASELGLKVVEEDLSLARVLAADEVFITGALRGIEAVSALNDASTTGTRTVTRLLSTALRKKWFES